ncbi:MAG: prolipoprotein diacylglyceryl transferase family protein [Pseudomonadota bacterium]
MQHFVFVSVLALLFTILMRWGFIHLPEEKWQILASVPRHKHSASTWNGINFTFYGLFTAFAYTFATAILVILLESVNIPLSGLLILIVCILGICVPASKLIARIVEKKSSTFTVSGASFTGIALTPLVVIAINHFIGTRLGFHLPVMVVMAGLATAYAFGEGIGRLACISFGCCYGKCLSECPPWIQRFMKNTCFVFSGKTKKIAYAHGLDGQKVIPVQAITSLIFCASGLAGVYLFLEGHYQTAFLQAVVVTQFWRFVSELLRADYRGEGKISAYQILSAISAGLAVIICRVFPADILLTVDLWTGIAAMWDPFVIIFLQIIFATIFIYTGRSQVTASLTMFYVVRNRI